MGDTCSLELEESYVRVGKWDPHSMRMNARVYSDRSHEHLYFVPDSLSDSDDSFDPSNCDDIANLARCQTNQPMHDEEEIASARRGYKDAIEKGNDSLAIYWNTEYPKLCLVETSVFENGDLSLHVAIRVDNLKLILYLLTEGLSPNSQNEQTGDTPMHVACQNQKVNSSKVIALLLEHSADLQIRNNEGQTPLDVAYIQEHPDADVIALLSREGQDDAVMAVLEAPILTPTVTTGSDLDAIHLPEGFCVNITPGNSYGISGSIGMESMRMDIDCESFVFPPNTGSTNHSPLTLTPIPHFNFNEDGNEMSQITLTPLSIVQDIADILHPDPDPDPVESRSVTSPVGEVMEFDDVRILRNGIMSAHHNEEQHLERDQEHDDDSAFMSLTMDEISKLDTQRMVRRHSKHNPFKLHRQQTGDLLNRMLSIQRVEGRIPELEGWLKKRNKEGKWKKKWVVARGAFVLWADRQIDIRDVNGDKQQRREFNGHYNLYSISKVEPVTLGLRHERKWKFTIGNENDKYPNKVFVWKANNEQDRDDWVNGLQQRKDLLNLYHQYLEEDDRE